MEEIWEFIKGFSEYQISNIGRVYNDKRGLIMSTSVNNHGHLKISLISDTNERVTCSVAKLVADAFVPIPYAAELSRMDFDQVILLDGNFSNLVSTNLVWRPKWFAWRYTRQLKEQQPHYMHNLYIRDVQTGVEYKSIIEVGMAEGLLFQDVWRSTYSADPIFPIHHVFEVIR